MAESSTTLAAESPTPAIALAIPLVPALYLIVTSSFDLMPETGVYNTKRLLEAWVFIAMAALGLSSTAVRHRTGLVLASAPRWVTAGLGLFFVLGFVSASRHEPWAYGMADTALLMLIALLIPVLAACRQIAGRKLDILLLALLAVLGLSVAVQELIGLLVARMDGQIFDFEQMLVRFAHPRFYNQLQSWTIPLLACLPFVFGKSRHVLAVTIALGGLQWCVLVLSGGRGSFLAVISAVLLISMFAGRPARAWLRVNALAFVAGLVMFGAVSMTQPETGPDQARASQLQPARSLLDSSGRMHMWRLALEDASSHPLLGAGPGRFDCDGLRHRPAHPHSFPMRIISEWGIPAFMLIAVISGWLAAAVLRSVRPGASSQLSQIRLGLSAAVLAAAVHACLSGVLTMPASQVMAVLVCGWLLGTLESGSGNEMNVRLVRLTAIATLCLSLFSSVSLARFNHVELGIYAFRAGSLIEAGPAQPRYWQHGRACQYHYE